jgi:ribonuclease Z
MMVAETASVELDLSSSVTSKDNNKVKTRVIGRSRAGDATSFAIPELKWLFDCGTLVQGWKPRIIFLSHTHSDHVHFLTHMQHDEQPPTVYLPEESLPFVQAHLKAYQQMIDCNSDEETSKSVILRPTKPGEEIYVSQGGNKFLVRTLKMVHRIPCLGFSIFKLQNRLKEEYVGLPGKEIGRLRKSGVEITTSKEVPYLCFLGDTTAAVFANHPEILNQHSVIIVECSFVDAQSHKRAITTMHTHWDDLQPYVASNPDTLFVLTHFSLKYSTLRLRNFFGDLQRTYDNIHPMLVEGEIEREWHNSKGEGEPPRCQCRLCR